jgi:DNA polymerase III delta prime subunit
VKSVSDILKNKFSADQAGHFYLLTPNNLIEDDRLTLWTKTLIANIMSDQKVFNSDNILNHEDFLYISKDEKGSSSYKLVDFNDFFSFLNYDATRYKRKVIIIDNAEKMSVSVANKLLKTLEEPPIKATIFLLNSQKVSLLETIKSRAIKLNIPLEKSEVSQELILETLEEVKHGKTLDEFILDYKSNKKKEVDLCKQLTHWVNENTINAKQINSLDIINKQTINDHIFNAGPLNRLHKIYFLIKELIDG